jgi:dipeptidyl aminopeptidase/acylaminoacyl peptidase
VKRNLCLSLALPLLLLAAAPATGRAGPGSGNEKIVFVRADPSLGLRATEVIKDFDASGASIGSHEGPQFEATSQGVARRDEIALMNPDGSGLVQLHVNGSDPALSPDGSKIAYCSTRETTYWQIYVMNADGTSPKRLTNFNSGDTCGPVWSHDGRKIAFYAFALTHPSRNPEIWVMDADGSNQKRLVEHGIDPSWSPDDRRIAYASNKDRIFQIYIMNADGSNPHRVTENKGEDSNPVWAPDGAAIAFSSETEGDRRGLFLVGVDGSEQRRLAFSKHQDFCFPAWSPDGKFIAFTAVNRLGAQNIVVGEERPRCEQWSGEYQIFTLDSEGKVHRLTDAKLMAKHPSYGRMVSR